MSDRIEKTIDLKAPVERVWRALTDHREFGEWFRVRIDAPFVAGEMSRGNVTYPGYEHLRWNAKIERIEKPRLFSLRWHPYDVDPAVDCSHEPMTLVEFTLEPIPTGTRLTVVESGFDGIPDTRRSIAFRMNDRGWSIQMENIHAYLGG